MSMMNSLQNMDSNYIKIWAKAPLLISISIFPPEDEGNSKDRNNSKDENNSISKQIICSQL